MAPLVLFIVDRPGWAHDRKTAGLARALQGEVLAVQRYAADVTAEDVERADLIVIYYWLQVATLGHISQALRHNRQKVLMGICSHAELEGDRREEGLAVIREMARAVFVNNRMLHGEFSGLFDREVFYTPNGVDTNFFRPASRVTAREGLCVGWAGSLANHPQELRGFHDVVVPAIERTAGAHLRTAIREERWLDAEGMRDFYQSLDVYVCASRCEGTPNPCLEAAACGVPLVTTRVGNMPELIVDGVNGFFVRRGVEDVAERLAFLRDRPEQRVRAGQAIRASIESWDWTLQARHFGQMFDTVLALSE